MKRDKHLVSLSIIIVALILMTSSTSIFDLTEHKRNIVKNYTDMISICTDLFNNSKEGLIEENIGKVSHTVIEEGIFILEDETVKAVIAYMNDENHEVWLTEVYYNKEGEVLTSKSKNRGVKLK